MLDRQYVGQNPAGNPTIKSTTPRQDVRNVLQGGVPSRGEKRLRTDDELSHIVPAAISVATGGAVMGMVFFGLPGAIVGGIAGAILGAAARRRNGAS